MQLNKLIFTCLTALLFVASPVIAETKNAAPAKTYDEPTFIKMLGNKTRQQVVDMLGEPAKKQMSVKPSNADRVIGRPLKDSGKSVEMWYYNHVVRYDSKHTYKTAELTFVNGRCTNVAFFNN